MDISVIDNRLKELDLIFKEKGYFNKFEKAEYVQLLNKKKHRN